MKKNTTVTKKGDLRPFTIRDSLAYAAGDFGCNMSFALKGTMAIFWTQYMRMDSILYAALLIVVQIWDAVNDPLIGTLIDRDRRTDYKRGKFLAYVNVGSVGLLLSGALCFIPWFKDSNTVIKALIFVSGYILWDAFYTIANVPYGSLLSLISEEQADRASLSAWRSIGSMLGNMLPLVLLPLIIYDQNENIIGERVFLVALFMGFLGFLSFRFMITNTVVRVNTTPKVGEEHEKFNVLRAMGNFLRNRPAMGTTVAAMGSFIGMHGAATAVTVMFQSYFHNVALSGLVSMLSLLPILIFTPVARRWVVKYGKKELSVVGSLLSLLACILMLLLPITPDGRGILIYVLCQLLNSLGAGLYTTVSWSMMGDAVDYNEWKRGTREEGTIYSLHSFFRKLAQGLGPSIALVIMVALGYSEANGGNQTFDVALNMRYLVAALYLTAAVVQFLGLALIYNLDKPTVEQMERELHARRENQK